MKKVFAVCLAAGLMSVMACGPSAEEQAKTEQDIRNGMNDMFKDVEKEMKSGDSTNTGVAPGDTSHAGHNH